MTRTAGCSQLAGLRITTAGHRGKGWAAALLTLRGESLAEPARSMMWSAGVSHLERGAASRCRAGRQATWPAGG